VKYLPTPCGCVVQVQGDQALVLAPPTARRVLAQLGRWIESGIQDPEYRAQHVASARSLIWAITEVEKRVAGAA
jgi:hypothetical protein